ncbi:MAG: hypothetical protein JSS29_19950 [Proteobacteria bacterium]|nr:hypothetical protein [Pseudomonadota bacterium]
MFHGYGLFGIIYIVVAVIPFWRICKRVGLSEWLGLLIIVPIVNIIFIYWLAFTDWPIQKSPS